MSPDAFRSARRNWKTLDRQFLITLTTVHYIYIMYIILILHALPCNMRMTRCDVGRMQCNTDVLLPHSLWCVLTDVHYCVFMTSACVGVLSLIHSFLCCQMNSWNLGLLCFCLQYSFFLVLPIDFLELWWHVWLYASYICIQFKRCLLVHAWTTVCTPSLPIYIAIEDQSSLLVGIVIGLKQKQYNYARSYQFLF